MLILSLDTSGGYISAALNEDGKVLADFYEPLERGQAEKLMSVIDTLYKTAGRNISETQAVAVAVGPGSFTGVRIGLAAARGFGLALNVPVWGVSNFDTVSFGQKQPCVVALSTRRGDFYTCVFNNAIKEEAKILTREEIKNLNLPLITDEPESFKDLERALLPFNQHGAGVMGLIVCQNQHLILPPEAYYMRPADVTVKPKES